MTGCYDSAFLKAENSQNHLFTRVGAGEGNRTLISGLGSPHSTTEPHPPSALTDFYQTGARLATG